MTTTTKTKEGYTEAVGRRKESIARIRITPAKKNEVTINDRELHDYFPTEELRHTAKEALTISSALGNFLITAKITGGGIHSQSEAFAMGLARAIASFSPTERKPLKQAGLLSRDARAKERRKFGLKKARKAPQWSKR
jgi:small subunit ribosomal protein S9